MQRRSISALLPAALIRAWQGSRPVRCLQGDTSMFAWGREAAAPVLRPWLLTSMAAVLKLATPSRTPLPTTWTAFSR